MKYGLVPACAPLHNGLNRLRKSDSCRTPTNAAVLRAAPNTITMAAEGVSVDVEPSVDGGGSISTVGGEGAAAEPADKLADADTTIATLRAENARLTKKAEAAEAALEKQKAEAAAALEKQKAEADEAAAAVAAKHKAELENAGASAAAAAREAAVREAAEAAAEAAAKHKAELDAAREEAGASADAAAAEQAAAAAALAASQEEARKASEEAAANLESFKKARGAGRWRAAMDDTKVTTKKAELKSALEVGDQLQADKANLEADVRARAQRESGLIQDVAALREQIVSKTMEIHKLEGELKDEKDGRAHDVAVRDAEIERLEGVVAGLEEDLATEKLHHADERMHRIAVAMELVHEQNRSHTVRQQLADAKTLAGLRQTRIDKLEVVAAELERSLVDGTMRDLRSLREYSLLEALDDANGRAPPPPGAALSPGVGVEPSLRTGAAAGVEPLRPGRRKKARKPRGAAPAY